MFGFVNKMKKMDKQILIIELELSGHRGEYVRWISEGLLKKNFKIMLALTKKQIDHPSMISLKASGYNNLSVIVIDSSIELLIEKTATNAASFFKPLNLLSRDIGYFKVFKNIYKQVRRNHNIDFIVVPYLDYFLFALALLGSPFNATRWAGIIMRPDFHYHKMGVKVPPNGKAWIKELLFNRVLKAKSLEKLFTLDETMALYYAQNKNSFARKLVFLPEPVDQFQMDYEKVKIPLKPLNLVNKKYLLVYGAIAFRKGVRELLNTLAEMESPHCNILLAGRADEEVESFLQEPPIQKLLEKGVLKVVNKYITKDEEAAFFLSAHALWVGYLEHYRVSGVLVQAVRNNIPVIACEEGVIGWQVTRHKVGVTVNLQDHETIKNALNVMFADNDQYLIYKKNCAKVFTNNNFQYSTAEIFKTI